MKYVDLFSGCGGLSLGVETSGAELVLAVEKSDQAARTFRHNLVSDASSDIAWQDYLKLSLSEQAVQKVIVDEVQSLLNDAQVMSHLLDEKLDFVVGGPPCQGFSLAGLRRPDDVRNQLPYQYLEFVEKTQPKMVVIENVLGMGQSFSKGADSSFAQLQIALSQTGPGYEVQGVQADAVHYGAPQHRPRLLIVGLDKRIAREKNISSSNSLWKSNYTDLMTGQVPPLAPKPTVGYQSRNLVRDAVGDLLLQSPRSRRGKSYVEELNATFGPSIVPSSSARLSSRSFNHFGRKHRESTINRFKIYQFLKEVGIPERLLRQIADMTDEVARIFVDSELNLHAVAVKEAQAKGMFSGFSLSEIRDKILESSTRKHSQKVLSWDEPARTVVTLPDDYVHPREPRVFTVRELARFQGFPDSFEYLGPETTGAHRRRFEVPQYSQVGNAVSPWLGLAIGKMIRGILH
ncbi:DNA cytosine methyltransferase [Arthrobacter sp. NIO-1057]|uniref:DNA cytosine methyltransferase n=1 Tax=Arthrobacter sp. NIO-1057 TaxID=993071 RepID=UPI00071E3B68|nr:DNA cytosine methyltransferase [Arthrobacter sp. NIO-1057]KSU65990.1 DNA methyltransferase [Arthrobacter sp. NIO-1057]SCC29339.1 DNA (cytosine-5)-methyltransferase 1 [Arthrobacter sp. NIO-1057]